MANLTLTGAEFFRDGVPVESPLVGYETQTIRSVRYTFTAPSVGATHIAFSLPGAIHKDGAQLPLRYHITTDHQYHGIETYQGTLSDFGGQLDIRLSPGVTYYLWVFPGETRWGYYQFPATGTLTATGISEGFPTVGASAFLGQPLTVTILTDPAYTHRLTWKFGDRTGTIGENLGSQAQWTPPISLAEVIPNSPSGICTITCATYQNGVQIGSLRSCTVTLNAPQSLAPQLSADYYDTSEAHSVFPFFLEKISRIWVVPRPIGQYGASITGTAVLMDGKPYSGATLSAGDHILCVTATDSRGITGNVTYTVTILPYAAPQLELSASRCLADGTADDTGDHAKISFRGAVSPLEGNQYQLALTHGKATVNVPLPGHSFQVSTIVPADPEKTLSIQAVLRDSLRTAVRSMTLSTAYATMDFLYGGKGIALGAVATKPGFHCAMDAQFSGKLTDSQGRELVKLEPLLPAEGVDMTVACARVFWVLGAPTLQLQLTVTAELPRYTTLFPGISGMSKTQYVPDATGAVTIKCNASSIQTNCTFPPGTYTFHTALY